MINSWKTYSIVVNAKKSSLGLHWCLIYQKALDFTQLCSCWTLWFVLEYFLVQKTNHHRKKKDSETAPMLTNETVSEHQHKSVVAYTCQTVRGAWSSAFSPGYLVAFYRIPRLYLGVSMARDHHQMAICLWPLFTGGEVSSEMCGSGPVCILGANQRYI